MLLQNEFVFQNQMRIIPFDIPTPYGVPYLQISSMGCVVAE